MTGRTPVGFLVIGAQKAGTTSLFEYLRRHPEIHMPAEKDIAFFNREANFRRGMDWYVRTVSRDAPAGAVSGEASTYYMGGTPHGDLISNERDAVSDNSDQAALEEVVPRRISEALPGVRLIAVLRDPIDRAQSHHRMMVLERAESRSFDEAVDQLLKPDALEEARRIPKRNNNYIVNGEYFRVLAGYLRVVPAEQLKVVFSSELADTPGDVVSEIFEFIGVDPDFVPENIATRYRAGADRERISGLNLYEFQRRLAGMRASRRAWHALPDRTRARIDRGFTVASYRLQMWNARRDAAPQAEMAASTRRRLIAHYRPDGEALAAMLDRKVPWLAKWDD